MTTVSSIFSSVSAGTIPRVRLVDVTILVRRTLARRAKTRRTTGSEPVLPFHFPRNNRLPARYRLVCFNVSPLFRILHHLDLPEPRQWFLLVPLLLPPASFPCLRLVDVTILVLRTLARRAKTRRTTGSEPVLPFYFPRNNRLPARYRLVCFNVSPLFRILHHLDLPEPRQWFLLVPLLLPPASFPCCVLRNRSRLFFRMLRAISTAFELTAWWGYVCLKKIRSEPWGGEGRCK